ncbi:MAG: transcriptional regulator [Chlorobiaceae bacterium]|nr:transcriptional regulator [Chlorobiaceae bacterium]
MSKAAIEELPVIQKNHWQNEHKEAGYTKHIKLIGKNIIHSSVESRFDVSLDQMDIGMFENVLRETGLMNTPLHCIWDFTHVTDISYNYKKSITRLFYNRHPQFRLIVFYNVPPSVSIIVESFAAVVPDGIRVIMTDNYHNALDIVSAYENGTLQEPPAENPDEVMRKNFLAYLARMSWFDMFDEHIAVPSFDDKYYSFFKAIAAMQADLREKEKEKAMELEQLKQDYEQKITDSVIKLNAQIELNKKQARDHEKEMAELKARIANQDMELTRVSTAIAEKTSTLRNLLDQIYALDIDQDQKRLMTDSCLNLIETETIEKRLNIELTESDSVFLSKLQKKHPNLNQRELRISLLVKLNYDTREIARSVGISTRGMESIRYRMHKKLSLGKHQSIKTYLSDLAAIF